MIRKVLFLTVLISMVNYGYAQTKAADSLSKLLQQVMKTKQAGDLYPVLSNDFSIGVYSGKSAKSNLQVILNNLKVDSIKMGHVVDSVDRRFASLNFYSNGKDTLSSRAWLNERNQLLYIDLFDQLYRLERYGKSVLVKSIPFELENGFIILTAKVNQFKRPLRFLFDTGADGMAMSKSLADSIGLEVIHQQTASVVGGQQNISISRNNSVFFDSFELKQQSVGIFDQMGSKYDGIIGNLIAREYIIKVDYDRKRMDLYTFGDFEYGNEDISIPIAFNTGLIHLTTKIKVGQKTAEGNFIFDTGAGY